MSADSTARIRIERVDARTKSLTPDAPRLAPVRTQARRITSEMFSRVIAEEEQRVAHIARVLKVSETLVWQWLNPDEKQQVDAADIVALELAGSSQLAYAFADELARWLNKRLALGRTPSEHVVELGKAYWEATKALTECGDRSAKTHALRALKRRCDEALADLDAELKQ